MYNIHVLVTGYSVDNCTRLVCHGGHIDIPKKWNSCPVSVPSQACGTWSLFVCKRFLLFKKSWVQPVGAGHASEKALYYTKHFSEKKSKHQMGFEPTTLRDLVECSNLWATGARWRARVKGGPLTGTASRSYIVKPGQANIIKRELIFLTGKNVK